jgi:RNA polymerase sigma factor (TIGR02999 family)
MEPSDEFRSKTAGPLGRGDPQSCAVWISVLYDELRAMAQYRLNAERGNHTLSATALVNEAYLKLSGGGTRHVESLRAIDRSAFFALAAQAMRRILVDHARGKRRLKRGSGQPLAGEEALHLIGEDGAHAATLDAIALDEALTRLAVEHADAAQVVELRFFAGLTDQAIADVMQVNERTVRRHWTFARAWLARALAEDASPGT